MNQFKLEMKSSADYLNVMPAVDEMNEGDDLTIDL